MSPIKHNRGNRKNGDYSNKKSILLLAYSIINFTMSNAVMLLAIGTTKSTQKSHKKIQYFSLKLIAK